MRGAAYKTAATLFIGVLATTRLTRAAENDAAIRAAIERSVPLLQQSAAIWIAKRPCVSCHHQALGSLAVAIARERGFRVDESLVRSQLARMHPAEPPDMLVGEGGINGQFGRSYMLVGMAGAGVPASPVTDAMVHFLAGKQTPDGHWPSGSHRPPLEDASATVTALAVRALQAYGPPGRAAEWRRRIARAREWLERTAPRTGEERTFRLLGLAWAGSSPARIREAGADLLRRQGGDGGWAQIPTRASDPYATGQALVALNQAGRLSTTDPAYARGTAFLLRAQRPDGSWHVETRRKSPGLPYFETGFPYGEDQFISYAASAWATMALTLTVRPGPSPALTLGPRPQTADGVAPQAPLRLPPLLQAVLFGSIADVRTRLAAGDDVNARGPGGVTPLMGAVWDPARTRLLLERGADPSVRTAAGHSALRLAAGYDGARESLGLLLERGSASLVTASPAVSPILAAAESGEPEKADLLLGAGASLEDGEPDVTPLQIAAWQGDRTMVRFFADRGANLAAASREQGEITPLIAAAMDGASEQLQDLLRMGAPTDSRDEEGMTALLWAATVDPGHTEIVDALLKAGADPMAQAWDGRTALDQAEGFGHWNIAARLRSAGARCD